MKALLPISLAALAAGAAMAAEPTTVPIAGTVLDVSATGTVTRPPDLATISAGVVTQARGATDAMAENARRMTATIAALKAAGVADRDIQTTSIGLSPQFKYADNAPPVLTGYQASNSVMVRLRALDQTGRVLDALVAAGANQIDGPTFAVDKPEAALDEARVKALAMARARAELYAKAAGLTVRRIVRIGESENSGPVMRPMMAMAMRKSADTPVESGEQSLSVTVSVTFELQ